MDIIFIKGLSVKTVVGIYRWERKCLQRLIFDLDVGYDNNCIQVYHNTKGYLNYEDISNFVNKLISKNCFFLLESVAESVARGIILYFCVPWIRVKVSKFEAIARNTDVGVIIERRKRDFL